MQSCAVFQDGESTDAAAMGFCQQDVALTFTRSECLLWFQMFPNWRVLAWVTCENHQLNYFLPSMNLQKDPKTEFGHLGRCCWLVVWNIFLGGGSSSQPGNKLIVWGASGCTRKGLWKGLVSLGFGPDSAVIRMVFFWGPTEDSPCAKLKLIQALLGSTLGSTFAQEIPPECFQNATFSEASDARLAQGNSGILRWTPNIVGRTATESNFPNVIHSWRNSSQFKPFDPLQ